MQFLIPSRCPSTLYRYMSEPKLAPIGILKYLYLLNGVPKVVSLLDSVSNLWLKNELVLSTTVNHFVPFNLCKTSSTSFALCLGLMIHLFKCVGSRHSLNLPFRLFHTHKGIQPFNWLWNVHFVQNFFLDQLCLIHSSDPLALHGVTLLTGSMCGTATIL